MIAVEVSTDEYLAEAFGRRFRLGVKRPADIERLHAPCHGGLRNVAQRLWRSVFVQVLWAIAGGVRRPENRRQSFELLEERNREQMLALRYARPELPRLAFHIGRLDDELLDLLAVDPDGQGHRIGASRARAVERDLE